MSASIDPTTSNAPALSEPTQPVIHDLAAADPSDPVDAWMNLHSGTPAAAESRPSGDERASGRIEAARRLVTWRTLEPRLEWVQWYLLIGAVLLVVCIAAGTFGWLLGWSVAAGTMTLWPLVGLRSAERGRLVVASVVLLAALLIAWQLDAHTELGALVLVGNRDAIIGISVLAAILGALTAARRWLVVQSGVWCMALAGSGWALAARSRSLNLKSDWQRFLPDKQARQLLAEPILQPFDFGGMLWLTLAAMALFGTCAYVGLVTGDLVRGCGYEIRRSAVNGVTLAVWLGGLLTPDGKKTEVGLLLLVLASIGGARARGIRDLVQIAGALAAGVLTREALSVAWNGLPAWWGPDFCDDFLFSECRPSGDLFTLVAGCGLLLGFAAIGHYNRLWLARLHR